VHYEENKDEGTDTLTYHQFDEVTLIGLSRQKTMLFDTIEGIS
jgi:hypothetical protein